MVWLCAPAVSDRTHRGPHEPDGRRAFSRPRCRRRRRGGLTKAPLRGHAPPTSPRAGTRAPEEAPAGGGRTRSWPRAPRSAAAEATEVRVRQKVMALFARLGRFLPSRWGAAPGPRLPTAAAGGRGAGGRRRLGGPEVATAVAAALGRLGRAGRPQPALRRGPAVGPPCEAAQVTPAQCRPGCLGAGPGARVCSRLRTGRLAAASWVQPQRLSKQGV